MKVLKFGGTSVGSAERISHVASLIANRNKNIVVLSAMSGTTNELVAIAQALKENDKESAASRISGLEQKYNHTIDALYSDDTFKQAAREEIAISTDRLKELAAGPYSDLSAREIVAQGEIMSTRMMNILLHERGFKSVLLPALDFMRTDNERCPDMAFIEGRLNAMLAQNSQADLFVTQGFICRNANGEIDNLERGGSDYTASIIGAAVQAEVVEIWTDINGMHNNDPRFVEGTRPVPRLSFAEAADLAYFGAKILHPTCIRPAQALGIPVRLLNTLEPTAKGTEISDFAPDGTIKAVAAKDNMVHVVITSNRSLTSDEFLSRTFATLRNLRLTADLVTATEGSLALALADNGRLDHIADELAAFAHVAISRGLVAICIAGDMSPKNTARAFNALSPTASIMAAYGSSPTSVAVLISETEKVETLKSLQRNLFS